MLSFMRFGWLFGRTESLLIVVLIGRQKLLAWGGQTGFHPSPASRDDQTSLWKSC